MSQNSEMVVSDADKALKSRTKGEGWATKYALPSLCSIASAIKITDAGREKATAPHKEKLAAADKPFKQSLKDLKERKESLRERFLDEYKSAEAIAVDGLGTASFSERWVYEIPDPNKVDDDYCDAVNESKIAEAIDNGIRSIKGVRITSERILRITPSKEA